MNCRQEHNPLERGETRASKEPAKLMTKRLKTPHRGGQHEDTSYKVDRADGWGKGETSDRNRRVTIVDIEEWQIWKYHNTRIPSDDTLIKTRDE